MDEALDGGNMNAVVRRGDTVLRTAGPWTPTVHRLLEHVRRRGFTASAVPLGRSDDGREVLTYLAGEVPQYPLPPWVWSPRVIDDAARMLRAWHDASIGFDRAAAIWQTTAGEPAEVIRHNDFAPHNLVFDTEHRVIGVIDVDMASPGSRSSDLAHLATRLIPLGREHEPAWTALADVRSRLDRLLTAYGPGPTRTDVLWDAHERLLDLAAFSDRKADELGKPDLHEHAAGYRADAVWLQTVLPELAGDRA